MDKKKNKISIAFGNEWKREWFSVYLIGIHIWYSILSKGIQITILGFSLALVFWEDEYGQEEK